MIWIIGYFVVGGLMLLILGFGAGDDEVNLDPSDKLMLMLVMLLWPAYLAILVVWAASELILEIFRLGVKLRRKR